MRLFVSAGEPSGDLHASNLVRALRRLQPTIDVHGFGGERMAEAGCHLLYPLAERAVIGFVRVLGSVPAYYRILQTADRFFRAHRPDAVVLLDYPGFHWWLAGRAKAHGIPVLYFVPPQIWAWASWRAGKMRRLVRRVLCNFPFEEEWYRARRIPVECVGHPYFDELRGQRLDGHFVAGERTRPGTVIGLLPGSRNQELSQNLPSLLRAARLIHARRPDTRFLVACLRPEHARRAEEARRACDVPIDVHTGRTPEIIHLAHSCIAVSGSVSLELLYRTTPATIVYRQHLIGIALAQVLMNSPYMSLVNLLAGKPLFPEQLTFRCQAEALANDILHWLNDRAAYESLCGELASLRDRVAEPGACARAAARVLDVLREGVARRAA